MAGPHGTGFAVSSWPRHVRRVSFIPPAFTKYSWSPPGLRCEVLPQRLPPFLSPDTPKPYVLMAQFPQTLVGPPVSPCLTTRDTGGFCLPCSPHFLGAAHEDPSPPQAVLVAVSNENLDPGGYKPMRLGGPLTMMLTLQQDFSFW